MQLTRPVLLNPFCAAVALVFLLVGDSGAQEEELQMALKTQERRIAGLTALSNQVRNFLADYLPGGFIKKVEETPAESEPIPEVEVREVKVVETPAAASDADLKAEEEKRYQASLLEAATKLDINGAFPKQKMIMIGAQKLTVGDDIAIELRENFFNLEILGIDEKSLRLRDQKSQLEVNVAIGISAGLPPGMSRKPPPGTYLGGAGQPRPAGPPMASGSPKAE
jgi:hypothetical protein